LRIVVGKGTGIGSRQDDDAPRRGLYVFDDQDGSYVPGGFIGMGSSEDECGPARVLSCQKIDLRIPSCMLDILEVMTQSLDTGDTGSLLDVEGGLEGLKFPSRDRSDPYGQ
jgi:hypothetical protein